MMKFNSYLSCFYVLLFFSFTCFSQPRHNSKSLETIAKSITWHKLIHYTNFTDEEFSGEIKSQRFYLSHTKKPTPLQELTATINAFEQVKQGSNINDSAICRFPARYLWLSSHWQFSTTFDVNTQCNDFKQWVNTKSIDSISLVFATGYLGNPASYYGHVLLKLNSAEEKKQSLLDVSLNFGAKVPDNEDPVSYIIKGLVGGYDADFTQSKFYFHTHNYLENELRDMWEYQLNLSASDRILVIAHLWELLKQNFTYYFLNENCVTRMYELLSIVEGVNLPPLNSAWVVPQNAIKKLTKATYQHQSLVKKVKYIPSRQSQLTQKYSQLNAKLKQEVALIINDITKITSLGLRIPSEEDKYKVIDTLLDYFTFAQLEDKENAALYKKSYDRVLSERYRLPMGSAKFVSNHPTPPNQGRLSSYSQLSFRSNNERGSGVVMTLRPAYYDQLDASTGHINNAILKMAELSVQRFAGQFSVKEFVLAELLSLKNNATGLPLDGYSSWKIKANIAEVDNACRSNCLRAEFKADRGFAFPLSEKMMFGAYLGGAIVSNKNELGQFYFSASSFLTVSISDAVKLQYTVEHNKYVENARSQFTHQRLIARYRIGDNSNNMDIRFGFEKEVTTELFLSLGYYW